MGEVQPSTTYVFYVGVIIFSIENRFSAFGEEVHSEECSDYYLYGNLYIHDLRST
jgi:hypothetical protein